MNVKMSPQKVARFCTETFTTFNVNKPDAATIADNLLQAELRGVRSHGLVQVKNYINYFKSGRINASPKIRIENESTATLVVDGDNGPGSVTGKWTMEKCIEKAKNSGAAFATVKNGTHFGMAAYYAMMALEHDMIGIASCNAGTIVSVYGGISRALGTNPICLAAPADKHLPLVYDGATSEAAFNKIFFAHTEGRKIPFGWALDSEGNDTDDPKKAMEGSLIPFGGYKGSGLSVFVNVFCGLLSGAAVQKDLQTGEISESPQSVGFLFGAIDISRFQPPEQFKKAVDVMIDRLKASKKKSGISSILMPGEPEFLKKEENLRSGLCVGRGVLNDLKEVEKICNTSLHIDDCAV